MVTLDDKFSSFSKMVLDKAANTFEEHVRLIDQKNQQYIEDLKKELENKALDLKSKGRQQAQREKKLLISSAKLEQKRRVMKLKDEQMEALIQKIRHELELHTETPEYVLAINAKLELFQGKFKDLDSAVIQLSEKDLASHQKAIQTKLETAFPHLQGNLEFEPLAPEYIGGFILFNGARTVRYDATLKALLEDWMDRIGEMLHDTLNKAGMSNG